MYDVTLIPGDGIGPEITKSIREIIEATGVKINWEIVNAGEGVMDQYGTPLPEEVLESVKKNKVALKGPITTPVGSGFRSVNVAIRQKLDLYVNLRPAKTMKGAPTKFENLDVVIFRENTEGLYAGIEHMVGDDAAESIKIITRKASERIVRAAFEYAKENNRKKVTAVHKANILKLSDGLFKAVAEEVAKDYPEIEFDNKIVDNMCMQLVQYPENYDVLVLPNLYGDIVSDLCAGLIGGLGLTPGANLNDELAVFEAVHGSAPDIAGENKANPIALLLSACMMLNHLGEKEAASAIEEAVAAILAEGKVLTGDLGGNASTTEITAEIIKKVKENLEKTA
ncbi:isocitrate dehydrogenase (NAD+) [Orenia metallireducens]|jgi:isocitrate dehydrogenase (NAD+)|uniref:Isocitrate dehydrogenase (NAD+) n=1 Tax=Orenia metallireducens TaxID=1413210 RepID=A0A285GBD2_9FIRM|nr:isocitrate dehydrogenase (NAD(+)) [Orenia metallireducens]PRX32547.1 isocitrate dehydrogenase (NAD+) [Orenia metallireducens]SNY20892.1 isocitrate dehydrogenase (NAD+) [Orenia metallireducens]